MPRLASCKKLLKISEAFPSHWGRSKIFELTFTTSRDVEASLWGIWGLRVLRDSRSANAGPSCGGLRCAYNFRKWGYTKWPVWSQYAYLVVVSSNQEWPTSGRRSRQRVIQQRSSLLPACHCSLVPGTTAEGRVLDYPLADPFHRRTNPNHLLDYRIYDLAPQKWESKISWQASTGLSTLP